MHCLGVVDSLGIMHSWGVDIVVYLLLCVVIVLLYYMFTVFHVAAFPIHFRCLVCTFSSLGSFTTTFFSWVVLQQIGVHRSLWQHML